MLLARIEVNGSGGALFVDLLTDPAQIVLFRTDMGLVHLQPAEIRHLAAVLYDTIAAWDDGAEMFIEIDASGGTLFVNLLSDPPEVIVWRSTAGLVTASLVRVERAELPHLVEVLTLPAWILAVIEERGNKSQRRDGGLCEQ